MPAGEVFLALPKLERRQNFLQPCNGRMRGNSFFSGREKILEALRAALEKNGAFSKNSAQQRLFAQGSLFLFSVRQVGSFLPGSLWALW